MEEELQISSDPKGFVSGGTKNVLQQEKSREWDKEQWAGKGSTKAPQEFMNSQWYERSGRWPLTLQGNTSF